MESAAPPGWVQRTTPAGGRSRHRFHRDRDCAERSLRTELDRAAERGQAVDGDVLGPMTYADARRLGTLTLCRCPVAGGRGAQARGRRREARAG